MSARHCSICNVPTDGLWMDRALCDGCLDEMADTMTSEYIVASPDAVARYIGEARASLGEAQDEFRSREP